MEKNTTDREMAFDHVKNFLQEQKETIEIFKSHMRDLLNSVTIIITATGLFLGFLSKKISINPILIVIAFVLFGVMGGIYGFIIKPIKLYTPIEPTTKNIRELFFDKTKREIYDNLIGNGIFVIKENEKIIESIARWSNITNLLFLLIIITIVIGIFL